MVLAVIGLLAIPVSVIYWISSWRLDNRERMTDMQSRLARIEELLKAR